MARAGRAGVAGHGWSWKNILNSRLDSLEALVQVLMQLSMRNIVNLAMLVLIMVSIGSPCSAANSAPPAKPEEQVINIAGGVQKPGRYDWFKGMTLLDAIKAAGGLTDSSVPTIKFAITHADGTRVVYFFHPGTDTANKPPLLQIGDMVNVAITLKSPSLPTPLPKPAN
jgi:hypothetical protein